MVDALQRRDVAVVAAGGDQHVPLADLCLVGRIAGHPLASPVLHPGVALAFFLEYINRRVRGIKDIEDFVGLKVIGTIPTSSTDHVSQA